MRFQLVGTIEPGCIKAAMTMVANELLRHARKGGGAGVNQEGIYTISAAKMAATLIVNAPEPKSAPQEVPKPQAAEAVPAASVPAADVAPKPEPAPQRTPKVLRKG